MSLFFLLGHHSHHLHHPWGHQLPGQLFQFCCMAVLWDDNSRTRGDEIHKERPRKAHQGKSVSECHSSFGFWAEKWEAVISDAILPALLWSLLLHISKDG